MKNRRVLLTGGTGFFGQAFLRHAGRVRVYSRDEFKQAELRRRFPDVEFMLGDVRDRERLAEAMAGVDLVVHAAALKRIEVGRDAPSEMVKTNVIGTMNVLAAAGDCELVALSSDKAFEPISPYGHSKALMEGLVRAAGKRLVRYGNVAGSTGSVIPTWRRMLETSSVVPVTDPDCTRFWMTVDQAVDVVRQAVELKTALVIPELPAFRLGDLAEAMGAEMNIVGLGYHEKKHESMAPGHSSAHARRMTAKELKEALDAV